MFVVVGCVGFAIADVIWYLAEGFSCVFGASVVSKMAVFISKMCCWWIYHAHTYTHTQTQKEKTFAFSHCKQASQKCSLTQMTFSHLPLLLFLLHVLFSLFIDIIIVILLWEDENEIEKSMECIHVFEWNVRQISCALCMWAYFHVCTLKLLSNKILNIEQILFWNC